MTHRPSVLQPRFLQVCQRSRCALAFSALLISSCVSSAASAEEPTRRIDGYKGIWFTLGQYYGKGTDGKPYSARQRKPTFPYGDKYSGGLGTYTAKHVPLAIYSEAAEKTFFVYGGTPAADKRYLLCMISYYDHKTGQVPKPVVVHDKNGVDDPHDNPSIAIDDEGYLWVFVSGRARARPGFKYRSKTPYSIDGFELVSEEELTYPQPHYISGQGFVHLFTKYTGVRELYWETSPDGAEWTADQKLAGIREPGDSRGGHYQTSARRGNRIGTFFNRHPAGNVDRRTDLYYVETSDGGKTWTTVDGTVLKTPLTEVENPARVADYASQKQNVYLKDMDFDADGNPVLLYVTSAGHEPGPPNDPRQFCVVRHDGQKWITSEICKTDHNYDMGSLAINQEVWTARVPALAGPQPYHGGGEVVMYESRDKGESWKLIRQVTSDSPRNHNYVRQPISPMEPFVAFWADGDPTKLGESHLYFCDSTGENVWRLPYEMKGDFAKPQWMGKP
ncbi:BNR-4 repeat-containing protein [Roseiconus lacunae]|uniref:BNR-4 repeat-containing protein n=1 Tax=Roseiconus lacunae TaxID=2605694 RepID=A0ABT7PS76_9BACT|nr:BNR-4 repeat-containing protein [Roseiconus lacunae]MDM4019129.1 BNR-4 repeat-containing protein [Roseiconus lacunae]